MRSKQALPKSRAATSVLVFAATMVNGVCSEALRHQGSRRRAPLGQKHDCAVQGTSREALQ